MAKGMKKASAQNRLTLSRLCSHQWAFTKGPRAMDNRMPTNGNTIHMGRILPRSGDSPAASAASATELKAGTKNSVSRTNTETPVNRLNAEKKEPFNWYSPFNNWTPCWILYRLPQFILTQVHRSGPVKTPWILVKGNIENFFTTFIYICCLLRKSC